MPLSTCGVLPAKSISTSPRTLSIVTAAFSVITSPPARSKRVSASKRPAGQARIALRIARSDRSMISSESASISG